jgi:hypothetical protein
MSFGMRYQKVSQAKCVVAAPPPCRLSNDQAFSSGIPVILYRHNHLRSANLSSAATGYRRQRFRAEPKG